MAGSKVVIPSVLLGIVGIAVAVVTVRDLFSQIRRPRPVALRSFWMSIGPMPNAYSKALGDPSFFNSGRVASIAVDPGDFAHWLVGFGNGGIWETHDTGVSFVPLTDNQPTLATGAIAFAPSDPSTIYAAWGRPLGQALHYQESGF